MRKIVLTKKLDEKSMLLFEGIDDLEFVEILDGDNEFFKSEMRTAFAVLLSTAYDMDKDLINNCQNLKVISRTGVGYDNVDVATASLKNIIVLNTPCVNVISVAEHTVALICGISKQLAFYDRQLRAGNFAIRRSGLCVDMHQKKLGLIGCGRIGIKVAEKLRLAFNMEVSGYDPFVEYLDDIKMCKEIEEIFKKSDYISVHVPLTDKTRNLVDGKKLRLMKKTAFIINTSRGGVIDEKALFEVLNEGDIAGAALDVFNNEPLKKGNPLTNLNNVILTPHSAALSKECSKRVAFQAAQGIADCLKGGLPNFIVNKNMNLG